MYLPINGKVICEDGEVGHTTCVIVDPTNQRVTDMVVSLTADHTQHLISVDFIAETTPDLVRLNCSQQVLEKQQRFTTSKLLCVPTHNLREAHRPVRTLFTFYTQPEQEHVPEGEFAIHTGACIHAADGRLGTISEFIVDDTDRITHIVLDESHWYGTLHSLIPIDAVDHIHEDRLVLKLTKDDVARLPHRRSICALHREP